MFILVHLSLFLTVFITNIIAITTITYNHIDNHQFIIVSIFNFLLFNSYCITITDLQKASGVARTTFYRSFDTISDVLYWKCDIGFYEALNISDIKEFNNEFSLARHYFDYWLNNSEILELLIKINRQDIIYSCHIKNAEILQAKFGRLENLPQNHNKYFMAIRTGLIISILTA